MVVIGGGIQGCATAFFLAKRGQNVTLIEKDRIGRHASGVNAGGVRRLGRDILEIPLSLAAMDIWQNLCQEIGEYAEDFHPCYYLKVAVDEAGRELGLMRAENLREAGFTHEVWVKMMLFNYTLQALPVILREYNSLMIILAVVS